jgi:hypothetical protein
MLRLTGPILDKEIIFVDKEILFASLGQVKVVGYNIGPVICPWAKHYHYSCNYVIVVTLGSNCTMCYLSPSYLGLLVCENPHVIHYL